MPLGRKKVDVFSFLPAGRYASAVYAVIVCPFVRPSVTSQNSTKMAKHRITQIAQHAKTVRWRWNTRCHQQRWLSIVVEVCL